KAGTGYTLAASSGTLAGATSSAFSITVGAATHVAFLQQPTAAAAAQALSPAVTAQVLDAGNNLLTSTARIRPALGSNPGPGSLLGTTPGAAVNGVALHDALPIYKAGTGYTLAASSGTLAGATSSAFSITAGAATHLAFLQQPTAAAAAQALSPAVTAQVLDA